jgi:hypothetical protein
MVLKKGTKVVFSGNGETGTVMGIRPFPFGKLYFVRFSGRSAAYCYAHELTVYTVKNNQRTDDK